MSDPGANVRRMRRDRRGAMLPGRTGAVLAAFAIRCENADTGSITDTAADVFERTCDPAVLAAAGRVAELIGSPR